MSDDGGIHYENPFATPVEAKTAGRSLRGRLAGPVTIWTARGPDGDFGLTMSSVLVADGDPPQILGLLSSTTDLYEVVADTKRFVLHVLERKDWKLADIFAGLRPNPGGPFAGLSPEESDYGPVLPSPVTAFCTVTSIESVGYHELIRATLDRLDAGPLTDPLIHFRGHYQSLTPT